MSEEYALYVIQVNPLKWTTKENKHATTSEEIGRIALVVMAAVTDGPTHAQTESVRLQLHPPRARLVGLPELGVYAVRITKVALMADA